MRVLVTGVTGYIGGRLVPRLLERGHEVRVLVRDARRIRGRPWAPQVQVFEGDLQVRTPGLEAAFADLDAAYYLVHSMYAGADFAHRDRVAARNFVELGRDLPLVVYLGGILPRGVEVSEHLGSRAEVGEILRAHLPTTEFRAGPILGSGSASFEMVRYLTERLPVMVTPRWIRNPVQPIGVRDILSYLLAALEKPPLGVLDVGTEPLTFGQMMEGYARVRGFRRYIFPTPWLLPRLAALWVGLVTPIPNRLAVPLVEGVVHPVVGDTSRARELFPEIRPLAYEAAVELALQRIQEGAIETRWSGALTDGPTYEFRDREGLVEEVRTCHVRATPAQVYRAFTSLGGERGWLVWNWAWWLRGWMDRMLGGPAPGPSASHRAPAGRGGRLLARRGPGAGPVDAPPGGDEGAGEGLAAVRGACGGGGDPADPDRHVRPPRPGRGPLLVCHVPRPPLPLQRHAGRGGPPGRGTPSRPRLTRALRLSIVVPMLERHLRTSSEAETEALGERLAARLRVGDVVALYGDLGAGKTTFVRGLARGLGSEDPVSSPTFVLMHVYEGRLPLYHFDAWRLSGPEDLAAVGAEEYLEGDGVAVVEWSERAEGLFPSQRLEVHLERGDEPEERRVRLVGRGARGMELAEDLD